MAGSFTDADVERVLGRMTVLISELPGVTVSARHGNTAYVLRGTSFAMAVGDHHGDGRLAVWVRASRDEQEALVAARPDRYFVPPYLVPRGWVAACVGPDDGADWDELAALVERAWRMGATRAAVRELDGRRG